MVEKIPAAPKKTIHVRLWSGQLSARITEMANSGKAGKTCRAISFGISRTCGDGYGEVLNFFRNTLPGLTGDESLDDVAILGRALKSISPDFRMDEETIRGVDAPVVELRAGIQRKWFARADENGVELGDLTDQMNEPRSSSRGSANRAYKAAAKVWAKLAGVETYSEARRVLEAAGLDLHSYCAID